MDIQEKYDYVKSHIESATPSEVKEICKGLVVNCSNVTFTTSSGWLINLVEGKFNSTDIPIPLVDIKEGDTYNEEIYSLVTLFYNGLTKKEIKPKEPDVSALTKRIIRLEQSVGNLYDRQVIFDVQNRIKREIDKFIAWSVNAGFNVSKEDDLYVLKLGHSSGRMVVIDDDTLWLSNLADIFKIKVGDLIDKLTRELF